MNDAPRLQGFTAEVLRRVLDVVVPIAVTASPDGELLAVGAARRGDQVVPPIEQRPALGSWDMLGQHLRIINAADGSSGLLLADADATWAPSWSSDGSLLAFFAWHQGSTGVWVWNRKTRASKCLSTVPLIDLITPLQWGPDDRTLVALAAAASADAADSAPVTSAPATSASDEPAPDVTVLFSPRRADGTLGADPTPSGLNFRAVLVDVVLLDVTTGEALTLLPGISAERAKLSPDRHLLAVVAAAVRPEMSRFGTVRDLTVFDVATGTALATVEGLTSLNTGSAGPAWSPDSTRIAVIRDGYAWVQTVGGELVQLPGPGTLADVSSSWSLLWSRDGQYLLGLDTWDETGRIIQGASGPSRMWGMHVASQTFAPLALPDGCGSPEVFQSTRGDVYWSDAGGRVAVLSREPESRQPVLRWLPLDGSAGEVIAVPDAALPHTGGLYPGICADVADDSENVYYRAENETAPPEMWRMDRLGDARRVTRWNEGFDDWPLTPARMLSWSDAEGVAYRGALMLPPGHDGKSTVPIVIDTYPMPNWCDRLGEWDGTPVVFRQVLLAEGYGVFIPSMVELPEKDPFARKTLDRFLVTGLDELVRLGLADDRVAVMGQSFGGYMVNCAVTTTTRFKAAVSAVGMANVTSWFGQVWVSPEGEPITHGVTGSRSLTGGAPFEHPDAHIEQSPVFHLDQVETPLLIVHGDRDHGARPEQGREMFVGLKYLGREVIHLTYHGEDHGPMFYTEPNRTHLIEQILSFLHRHLRAEEA